MNKKTLLSYLKNNKQSFKNRYGLKELYLFGSFARDEENNESDIDLMVDFDEKSLTLRNFLDFKREIEKNCNKKVDLATRDMIKPQIWNYINKDLIIV
jgi:predicted nucleotidyltransferase